MTTTNKTPPPQWRNAITDSIKYDPLTGTYKYLCEPIDTTPNQVNYLSNQFWTPMGQPKRNDQSEDRSKNKKY